MRIGLSLAFGNVEGNPYFLGGGVKEGPKNQIIHSIFVWEYDSGLAFFFKKTKKKDC
jgi:hypothetical protein